ncbi:hypothetical protein DPMN_194360 [Dreissena polymorpha]|uniref:Uncharacterized protein n=2 Tax=Dreissena polymorpha TaxID=45954 RepID=A0A9D3Y606_DREPO|nr:hypothetical protein DPMN_194360 [Dreissena polymorpha]
MTHPDFVPLESLDLSSLGINLHQSLSRRKASIIELDESEDPFVDVSRLTEGTVSDPSGTLSAEESLNFTCDTTWNNTAQSNVQGCNISQFSNIVPSTDTLKQRRASIGGLQSRSSPQTDPDKLSVSWPRSNSHKCTEHKHAPNLSFLSPKTLKLLNIKDPSLYQPPVNNNADVSSQGHEKSAVDDLCLIKIADRLNNAAARSSKRTANGRDSRSPSIERIVPPSVSQPFSPIASGRFSKAQSVDRNSPTTAFTSKLMDLPNAPFSPKFAMFPRTRSASMDNKSTCDTIVKGPSILEPLNDNNIRCLTRERSVSDPVSPTPKPVGFSSPVAGKSNSVTIMESKNAGQSLENIQNKSMDFSVKSCSEINGSSCLGVDSKSSDTNFDSYAEDDVLEVKLNNLADASEASEMFTSTVSVVSENPVDEAEYSETIVVMTESGESLSEEDALKIAEELINKGLSNIVEQTDQDIQYGDNRSGCDDLDIDETSEKDTKVFDGELSRKTSSPFIPEMAASYNPLTDKHPGVIQERNLLGRETIQRKLLPVSITQTVRNSSSSSLESGPDSLSNNTLELNAPDEETKVVFSIGGNEEEQHLSTIVDDSDDDVEVLVVDPVSDSDSDVLDITDSILGISTHGNSTAVILAEDESNTFTVPNNNADKSELDIVSGIRKHENTFEKSMGISDITGLQNNDEVDGDKNVRMEGNVEVTEISKLENKQTINSSCPKAVRGSENEQVANTELPVLDPIAKKIKEESIAKSCPEEKGPFKCNNCKREYRTESSYQVHVENCNFCVSSSDDDDDEEESENGHEVNTKKTNGRVTRSNRRNSKQIKTTLDEDPQTVEETIENPKSRTSLRQSTVCQRVAHEVEEQRVKQESNAPKRRGRPSLNKNFSSHERSKDADQSSLSESDMNYTSKEKIMNTRRSAKVIAEEANDSVKTNNEKEGGQCMVKTERDRKVKDKAVDRRMTRSKSQESHSLESEQIKVECESEHVVLANLVNRKRHLSKNSTESGTSNIDIEVHSPQTKRRTVKELSACDSEDVLNTLEESSKELAVNDSIGERPKKRGRPKKHTSANPKNADGQADVKCNVDAKMDDVGSSEFVRVNNTSSEINTQAISTFSGMENDTDNKGETIIESDISFSKSTDSNGSKKDLKVSEKSQSGTGDGKHTCNSGCEHESETEELRTKDSDSDDAMQISDTDKIPVQPDQEMNHVAQTDARNTSFEANTDLTSVSPNPREMKTISPSNQSLPAAVLKLLKEGHKVVIRNPKLNKNFLWQKTENGYIGKPFDKELPLQSNIKTNNSGTSSKETGLTGPATDVSKAADVNKQVPSFLGQNMSSPKQMGLTNQQQASNNQLMNNITFSTLNQSDVKTQAKFVVENIQKLIEQNRQAKVASTTSNTVPVFVRGDSSTPIMAAEYIGGILISPSKANYILDDIKNTIQCTAPIADQTIQNTLQFQQQFGSPPLNNIQQSPPSYSILSPLQQQYPIMSQHFNGALDFQGSGFPTYSTGLTNIQTGFASVQPGLFQTGLNTIAVSNVQIFNQCGMQTQNSTLQAAISPIPVLNMGYISVPISSISTQQVINQPSPVLNQSNAFRPGHVPFSFATVVNSGNGQMTPYMSSADQSLSTVTTVTNASLLPTVLQNIMSKPFSASPISTVSLSQHTNLPQSVSSHSSVHGNLHSYNRTQSGSVKMYDKIKSLLSKRRSLSTRKTYTSKELKRKSFVNVAKVLDSNGTPVITVKDHNTAIDTPVATTLSASNQRMSWPNKLEMLKLKRKYVDQNLLKSPTRLKRKYKKRKKMAESTLPDGNSRISAPHYGSKPTVMHSQKESTTLPVAAMEEEVRDVPLSVLEDERSPDYAGVEGHNLGHLEFEIASDDGFTCRADTMDGAWKQVTEKLQDARTASRQKHLSYAGLSGVQMFGLSHPQVVYLVEQMHGASYCRRYAFKYHKHELVEREIELLNPTGCIRTEPFSGRNPWDMFSFLMSRYRQMPSLDAHGLDEEMALKSARRATSMDLPMAMRFRKLKEFSKECVGVYRSKIHGRGLFCKRSIDAGEMIIEYAGEVIRNALTDVREKYYESKGIGCYMFRIDEFDVVDATMRGSAARFINHSCEPNCYSKVITVDNRKHIVIFAMRKILRGEELTYDYKFPIEEVKIPCTCGARKCRKYLN